MNRTTFNALLVLRAYGPESRNESAVNHGFYFFSHFKKETDLKLSICFCSTKLTSFKTVIKT
jgi:hypothetical protein